MNKFRILIVDDEPDIRMIVKTALSTKFEVVEAENGLDALEKIERAEPDFVVLDIMMPLMDGFDTCASIRKHNRFSATGVYFLTAKSDKESLKKGYELGADLYLQKPFDPFRLLKNIEIYFEEKSLKPINKKYTLEQLKMMDNQPYNKNIVANGSGFLRPGYLSQTKEIKDTIRKTEQFKPPVFSTGKPRILVAGADCEFLVFIHSLLKNDYEVIIETQSLIIVESIINFQPEIVIIDYEIHGLDTVKLIQLLKQNKNLKYIETFFVSCDKYNANPNSLTAISGNPLFLKGEKGSIIIQAVAEVCYKQGFQVYNKLVKFEDIPSENLQKIMEQLEEERKAKEREYFKIKHKNLQDVFDGYKKKIQEKKEEKKES